MFNWRKYCPHEHYYADFCEECKKEKEDEYMEEMIDLDKCETCTLLRVNLNPHIEPRITVCDVCPVLHERDKEWLESTKISETCTNPKRELADEFEFCSFYKKPKDEPRINCQVEHPCALCEFRHGCVERKIKEARGEEKPMFRGSLKELGEKIFQKEADENEM